MFAKVEKKVSHLREKRGTHYEDIINHDELNQAMSQGNKNIFESSLNVSKKQKQRQQLFLETQLKQNIFFFGRSENRNDVALSRNKQTPERFFREE